jgi:hypothetical protein
MGMALRTFIENVDPSTLLGYKYDAELTIALRAAWETSRVLSDDVETIGVRYQRFFGFLEGRSQLRVPAFWERGLVSFAKTGMRRDLSEAIEKLAWNEEYKVEIPQDTAITKTARGIKITRNKAAIFIDEDLLKTLRKKLLGPQLKVHIFPKKSYVAICDWCGSKYPLVCVDSESGRLLWTAEVWALGAENFHLTTGKWKHEFQIIESRGVVGVFGRSIGGYYFEMFDQKTGNNMCRFVTNWYYSG